MKRKKLLQLAHISAGIITLIYGFDSFETGNFSSATYYLSLSIIFMIVAGAYNWITQMFMKADIAFFLLESVTVIYTAWLYKLKGHQFLFYLMAVAGLLYFIFAIISLNSKEKTRHRSRTGTKKRRNRSSLSEDKRSGGDNKKVQ